MNGDACYLGAYWTGRRESIDDCARRFAQCLVDLGAAHPALGDWFKTGKSRSSALAHQVTPNASDLRSLLKAGKIWKDDAEGGDTHHGYRASVWNGAPQAQEVGLMVSCGGYGPRTVAPNSCVVTLPLPEGKGASLYDPPVVRAMLGAVVGSWEPEWATFVSHRMRRAQEPVGSKPVVGWMTYLDPRAWRCANGLPSAVVREMLGTGCLLTAQAWLTEVHDDVLRAIQEKLVRA